MSRRGLSLSEVIVAVGICTIAVFALVSLQVASLRWKSKSGRQQEASLLASSALDETVSRLRLNFKDTGLNQSLHPLSGGFFRQRVQVTNDGTEADPDAVIKKVEVIIYWNDRQGEQHYRLVTRVYNG